MWSRKFDTCLMAVDSTGDEGDDDAVITEADLVEEEAEENPEEDQYIKGGYSPRLLQPGDLDIDAVIYEEEEDAKKLVVARKQVITSGRVKVSVYVRKCYGGRR